MPRKFDPQAVRNTGRIIGFRAPPDLASSLEQAAKDRDTSQSEILRSLLRAGLALDQPKQPQPERA